MISESQQSECEAEAVLEPQQPITYLEELSIVLRLVGIVEGS